MSATGRGSQRNPFDAYYTPSWCVRRLLEDPDLPFSPDHGEWLEPAVGEGHIVRAIGDREITWTIGDLRKPRLKTGPDTTVYQSDIRFAWRKLKPILKDKELYRFDVGITNPPFELASRFMAEMMKVCKYTCLLLRVNYLASKSRCSILRTFTPDVFVLPNRPSFIGAKRSGRQTDATEYAWFVWSWKPRSKGIVKVLKKTPEYELAHPELNDI